MPPKGKIFFVLGWPAPSLSRCSISAVVCLTPASPFHVVPAAEPAEVVSPAQVIAAMKANTITVIEKPGLSASENSNEPSPFLLARGLRGAGEVPEEL